MEEFCEIIERKIENQNTDDQNVAVVDIQTLQTFICRQQQCFPSVNGKFIKFLIASWSKKSSHEESIVLSPNYPRMS